MKFLRSLDELGHSLAITQGRIFEKSVENGIPSYFFIKSFMNSMEAKDLDDLNLTIVELTENEIFDAIANKVNIKRGNLLSYSLMRFIGYFYRMFSYLTNMKSKEIIRLVPINYLVNNFEVLHSYPIDEAVKEVINNKKIKLLTKEELFKRLYTLD